MLTRPTRESFFGGLSLTPDGSRLFTPRDLFGRLSGFDEGFPNGYEDVTACARPRRAPL